jgi:hypothetical protein
VGGAVLNIRKSALADVGTISENQTFSRVKPFPDSIKALLAQRGEQRQDDGYWRDFLCEFHHRQGQETRWKASVSDPATEVPANVDSVPPPLPEDGCENEEL